MQSHLDDPGFDSQRYLGLVECGILSPDERVELLEGQIVSMAPPSPMHDAVVHHVRELLERRMPPGTLVRAQATFLAGPKSVPEPDVAVLPGRNVDYLKRHPSRAILLVEVADSSLAQDRLTKSAIYARAAVPDYWILNLRDESVECFAVPDRFASRYDTALRATGDDPLRCAAFPALRLCARELFPDEP